MELLSVTDAGGDVLEIVGRDTDGELVHARGWVSATTNHYDADAYYPAGATIPQEGVYPDTDEPLPPLEVAGQLRPDAAARAMSPAEVGEYALSLLRPAAAAPVAFEGA